MERLSAKSSNTKHEFMSILFEYMVKLLRDSSSSNFQSLRSIHCNFSRSIDPRFGSSEFDDMSKFINELAAMRGAELPNLRSLRYQGEELIVLY